MLNKIRILHVEDNPIVAKLVAEMISSDDTSHYEINNAQSIKSAVDNIDKGGIDIILTDLQLPDSDGIDTFNLIYKEAPNIPIVIMTGTYEEEELAIEALQKGAQDYLRKSEVNPDSLKRAIRYAIERQTTKNELKKAYSDLKMIQEQLVQSEKLAGLARFSEGIAHEVRNPLGIIIGASEFLAEKLSGSPEDIRKFIDMIKNSAVRASDILASFLVYAKSRSNITAKVDLSEVIKNSAEVFRKERAGGGISLMVEPAESDMIIEGESDQIEEAVRNILNNAFDAIGEKGVVSVKLYKTAISGTSDNKELCVTQIDDTGCGVSEKDKPKLFEPFFTTKLRTIGKGRGLFSAKTIVESFGGTITIDSVEGKGTSVKIALPCCK